MPTTPNFSWVMPDPTDFVTNLPADFEIFGDAVDATVKSVKDTADAALPETIINAAGDLIYGTANDTAERLAIGTAGQVLTVNSGATAPQWTTFSSGGMTVLASGSLPTGSGTLTLSSISNAYKDLRLVLRRFYPSSNGPITLRLNNGSGNNTYSHQGQWKTFTGNTTVYGTVGNAFTIGYDNFSSSASSQQHCVFDILDYNANGALRAARWQTLYYSSNQNANVVYDQVGYHTDDTVTNRIDVIANSNFAAGTYILYGIS